MEGGPKLEAINNNESRVISAEKSMEEFGNVESLSYWRELKDEAPAKAEALIASIEGFESMEPREQIHALEKEYKKLGEDNRNRFIAYEIAGYGENIRKAANDNTRGQERLRMG